MLCLAETVRPMNEILSEALLRAKNAEPLSRELLLSAMQDARLSDCENRDALACEVSRILAFASVLEDYSGEKPQDLGADAPADQDKQARKEVLPREEFLARTSEHDGSLACVPAVLS